MSVFNGRPFLAHSIESILRQSFTDLEFIIIDDGSTDGSAAILKRYAGSDSRVRVVSQENRGLAASLNDGITIARGQWIARMDADDISHPRRLEIQLAHVTRQQADISGATLRFLGSPVRLKWHFPLDHESCLLRLMFGSPFGHPSVIMRTALARDLLYDQTLRQGQDYELWTRFAMRGAKMANCADGLLYYRRHEGQISNTRRTEQAATFEAARRRYCNWLGMADEELEIVRRFCGFNAGATLRDADALAELMMKLDFPGSILATEFNRALCKVSPASLKLIHKSLAFARRVQAKWKIHPQLAFQALAGASINGKVMAHLKRLL